MSRFILGMCLFKNGSSPSGKDSKEAMDSDEPADSLEAVENVESDFDLTGLVEGLPASVNRSTGLLLAVKNRRQKRNEKIFLIVPSSINRGSKNGQIDN